MSHIQLAVLEVLIWQFLGAIQQLALLLALSKKVNAVDLIAALHDRPM